MANASVVKLSSLISPAYYKLHKNVVNHDYTHFWLKGGRGSTKSSFISVELILGMMKHSDRNAVIFRKVGDTLRDSVYEQLVWAVEMLGVENQWEMKISPLSLIYKPTKQRILFRGVDDPQKTKSIKCRKGYFAYVWFEELSEFSCMDEIGIILQSILRGGENFWVFYSYNPPRSVSIWVNHEAVVTRPDKITHHSTYLDVPKEWLGSQFIIEAETLKATNPESYKHIYMGQTTGTGGEVFNNVENMEMSDELIKTFDKIRRGLDWGFAIDPFHYTESYYDSTRKSIYIYFEYHALNVSNRKAAEIINKQNKIKGLVVGDSSEPKSVINLVEYGVRCVGAKKGPGSIEQGMRFLTDEILHIYIDKKRCPNTYREFTNYELSKDRFGNFKSTYPDKDNHSIDATRYAYEGDMITKFTPFALKV